MNRLNAVSRSVNPVGTHTSKSDDDIVICAAYRTPLTKSKKGGMAHAAPEDLLSPLFKRIASEFSKATEKCGDIVIGNVLQPGAGIVSSRIASILGGFPVDVPIQACNRQCSSGLQAVATIANSIAAGEIDVGIAGGVESMTQFDMMDLIDPSKISSQVFDMEVARNCLLPMGQTSENVAEKYGITRGTQDAFAVASHLKADRAASSGKFKEEIVPVSVPSSGEEGAPRIVVSADDGIRGNSNVAALAKLKPAFRPNGTTTAGNASQVSDGAALVLLARRSVALASGWKPLAKFCGFKSVGCPPEIMGIGPAVAIPRVLQSLNLKVSDIDVWEINEAFASQASYCVHHLNIDENRVNPNGGAIALGHPLGATGARQIATILPEMRRSGKRFGGISMCIGSGMGAAAIIENEVL